MRVPASNFVQEYRELENDINWLLCELHKLIRNLNTEISSEIIADIEGEGVFDADDTVKRHRRDYYLLELLHNRLDNMSVKFQRLEDGSRTL